MPVRSLLKNKPMVWLLVLNAVFAVHKPSTFDCEQKKNKYIIQIRLSNVMSEL